MKTIAELQAEIKRASVEHDDKIREYDMGNPLNRIALLEGDVAALFWLVNALLATLAAGQEGER